ncbi:membrane protein [Polaribacter pacificus]|uniref:Membrane protein n=1 Tax=Polaribacter pacificus TaxID=1775173 RepID=A0A917I0U3_9FLAO|nr:TolC family protein [Polaribacter pacificus]GGH00503.1 membrane protein [Polaribacter pacificus]
MKHLFIISLFFFSVTAFGQSTKISLTEAIEIAQKKSPDYKANINKNQASYWRFKNYKASFLPQVRLSATLPSYSNSTARITNDQGQDIFVNQNQALFDTQLSISQNVPYTGGSLSISSSLERVDIFGTAKDTRYSVVPFSLNYYQNSIFYNPFKWDQKIEPLLQEEAKKDFIESMEQISLTTSQMYFTLLKSQMQLKIAEKNLSNQDTLFQIAKGRYKMGNIAENELLQMELAVLNSRNSLTTSKITLKRAVQNFSRYLQLSTENLELDIPNKLPLFNVDVQKAILEAQSNRKSVIEFRRKRIEAEKELARVKGSNRLELNVNANFGVSQQGPILQDLFQNYNKQQSITVTLGIPLFDWGVSKSKRKMAEANLDLVDTNMEQQEQAFEQEIYLHTLNWSNQRNFLDTSEKAQEIAIKRYEITKKRYILGKITITDLNIAQQEKDGAVVTYLNSLQKFWTDYYTLRRLTLYDFLKNKKIETADLTYD